MRGTDRLHPAPKGPLPAPESYVRASSGWKPARPGLVAMGTLIEPVPVTGLAANFSPMSRIAPPPFGSEGTGATGPLGLAAPSDLAPSALAASGLASGFSAAG